METNNYNVSRYNATKHGLRAKDAVLPWESAASFEDLQNSLFEEYAPSTPTQRELVQQLVQIFWKQRRIYSAENAIAQCEVAQIDDLRKKIWDDDKYELTPGEETSCNAIAGNVESERLIRYDAHLSRRLIRTLGLLHQLKVLENSKIINN